MDEFKPPSSIPQDLLLISEDLVGYTPPFPLAQLKAEAVSAPLPLPPAVVDEDDIASSGDEDEAEIKAALTKLEPLDDEEMVPIAKQPAPVDSDSDSDSGESDSAPAERVQRDLDVDEDEDSGGPSTSTTYIQTKNEIVEFEISIPEIEEVGPDEKLEKVGEILNVGNQLAIVRGLASDHAGRGSDRALDSDTLLVFEDGKVMGYIFETFGPTYQPLYQVKFNQKYPLDPEKVKASRPVFHVPERSKFVFTAALRRMKGSDASNVHDEEPGAEELEFSDDEEEAAHKSNLKRKRGGESRAGSAAPSSRQSTPAPSQMRDQDMTSAANPYGDEIPYDMDYSNAPRAAPIPYDDPYAESSAPLPPTPMEQGEHETFQSGPSNGRGRGRGGRGRGEDRGRGRGRGRGGDRDRGRGGGGGGGYGGDRRGSNQQQGGRSLSPTSLAIARATGQHMDGSNYGHSGGPSHNPGPNFGNPSRNSGPSFDGPSHSPGADYGRGGGGGYNNFPPQAMPQWGFQQQGYPQHQQEQQQQLQGFPQPGQFIQPHINPRFAAQFAMNMSQNPMFMQQQQQAYTPQYGFDHQHQPPPPQQQQQWNSGEWNGGDGESGGGQQEASGDGSGAPQAVEPKVKVEHAA